jgi:hypothetical protein
MRRLVPLCCLWLLAAVPAGAAPAERDLYVLGIALDQAGQPGGWVQVGAAGAWKETTAGAVLKGRLYTTESNGCLYVTDLGTGDWKQIGKPEFGATRLMFAAGDKLYTVETDGTLYRVDPNDGTWAGVGPGGAWKAARAGAVLGGRLYTAEDGGALWEANLTTGARKRVARGGFETTESVVAAGDRLCTIDGDGSLYRVNPADGSRERVGPAADWKSVRGRAVLEGRLYTAEADGGLRETDLRTGKREQLGSLEFGNTAFMFPAGDNLYTIETDGNLYRVIVKPTESIDAFDWCPEEVEKVFREQGRAFYRGFRPRLVLGKQATHAGALDGLAWLRQNATRDDLVVMYVGSHGFTDPDQGWGIGTADGKVLWGHEIKAELAKLPCHVLILIETCTSGGFAQRHKNDPPVPANVTALCACSGKQSTDNQLDLAVAEALYGRADFNGDGVVDLDELIRYTRLRYKEWWPNPKKDDGHETPVIVKSTSMPGSLPLTNVSPRLAAVVHNGDMWSALLEKQQGDRYEVHLLGWSSKPGEPYFLMSAVTRDCICLPGDGRPLLVEQNGTWYPARLLGRQGPDYKVHYLGYNEDEVVARQRIKYPFVGQPEEGGAGGGTTRGRRAP